MNYADIFPQRVLKGEALGLVGLALRRALILASAAILALLLSGGIFTFTPLLGYSLAHASGTSMRPNYKDGDVVLLQRIEGSEAQIGEIIVFEFQDEYVMHRVVERRSTEGQQLMLVTKGDNVPVPDRPILASQVKARLVAQIPLLGAASRLMDADGGFYVYRSIVLTIAVSMVAVWALTAPTRWREQKLRHEQAFSGEELPPSTP